MSSPATGTGAPRPVRERRRVGRFAVVGAANAVVDVAVFNVLVLLAPTRDPELLVVYNTVAVVAALANSYLWNSRWTFRDRAAGEPRARWRQRGLFSLQGVVNLGVNNIVLFAVSALLQPVTALPTTVTSNIAKVAAMLLASAVSYLLLHLTVFRGRGRR